MRNAKTLAGLTIVLAATFLTACDDEHPPGKDNGDEGPGVEDGDPDALGDIIRDGDENPDPADLPDPADDPADTPEDTPEDNPGGELAEDARSLILLVADELSLVASADIGVRAKLVNGLGNPVEGEDISFSVSGETEGSFLSAPGFRRHSRVRVETAENGEAGARLTAGEEATSFTLRIRHGVAEELLVDVDVSEFPEGDLVVGVHSNREGRRVIDSVEITLLPSEGRVDDGCAVAVRGAAPEAFATIELSDREALFPDLPTGRTYRVEARGLSEAGAQMATACATGGPIQGLKAVETELTLELTPLRFSGDPAKFEIESALAFLNGLSEPMQERLRELARALSNPASFFVRPISNRVPLDFGDPFLPNGMARQAVLMAAEAALEDYFRENVGNPAYERFDLAAVELLPILEDVGVLSELTLEGTDRLPDLDATTRWTTLVLTSPLFCATPEGEEPEPGCERREIPLQGDAKLGVQAEFAASLEDDDYSTEEYVLELDFRALFHVIFKLSILPAILDDPAVTSIAQVMERLADCDRIGALIAGYLPQPVEFLVGPLTTGFCQEGMHGWGASFDREIDALDGASSHLLIQEDASIIDSDANRVLDLLEDGEVTAQWVFDEAEGSVFHGDFVGTSLR